jgi:GrpB-like predicted nucleotidyltransferase (UPF0157 family)
MSEDDYLDRILIGGREPATITIVDYDETWPWRFREWADRIVEVLGKRALRVEHIGSTSVPGLAAKPIVDVLLLVADVEDEAAYVPRLESLGLGLRVREPNHRMLRTPQRDLHLHVCEPDRPEVDAYLDLRDRLRADAADRRLYAETKRWLAAKRWADMNDYADAKSDVIQAILARARTVDERGRD